MINKRFWIDKLHKRNRISMLIIIEILKLQYNTTSIYMIL